ncbi:hypothetical protein F383_03303 [Gossypium arboreum]|uniref:Uncharacterized protein n=1 Tax=Gossypium arboreum TaxID=29729 RepID=A0A0B0MZ87_GOSAR|nr:hypothetical protein F383_03303 [Gossypium arboreum]
MLRNPKNGLFLRVWETGFEIDTRWHMGVWPARWEWPGRVDPESSSFCPILASFLLFLLPYALLSIET